MIYTFIFLWMGVFRMKEELLRQGEETQMSKACQISIDSVVLCQALRHFGSHLSCTFLELKWGPPIQPVFRYSYSQIDVFLLKIGM